MKLFEKKPRCKLCNEKITDNNSYKIVLETLDGEHIVSPVCDGCVTMLNYIYDGVKALGSGENE